MLTHPPGSKADPTDPWTLARQAYERGVGVTGLIERFGLARTTLYDRIKREGWTWTDPDDAIPFDPDAAPLAVQERERLALLRLDHALTAGRVQEAAGWLHLHDRFAALTRIERSRPTPEHGAALQAQIGESKRLLQALVAKPRVDPLIRSRLGTLTRAMSRGEIADMSRYDDEPDLAVDDDEDQGRAWDDYSDDDADWPADPDDDNDEGEETATQGDPTGDPRDDAGEPAAGPHTPLGHAAASAPAEAAVPDPADDVIPDDGPVRTVVRTELNENNALDDPDAGLAGESGPDPARQAALDHIANLYAEKRSRIRHRLGYNDILRDLRLAGADPHLMEPPEP